MAASALSAVSALPVKGSTEVPTVLNLAVYLNMVQYWKQG
eukprot:SAG11_NODE_1599_length_4608_cov_8.741184_6_plen_40_part_00